MGNCGMVDWMREMGGDELMSSNITHQDPCISCHYASQACAYILDGNRYEDACSDKARWIRFEERWVRVKIF